MEGTYDLRFFFFFLEKFFNFFFGEIVFPGSPGKKIKKKNFISEFEKFLAMSYIYSDT